MNGEPEEIMHKNLRNTERKFVGVLQLFFSEVQKKNGEEYKPDSFENNAFSTSKKKAAKLASLKIKNLYQAKQF